ncbi:MAG TPA: hypothetical protein VJR92_13295 [Gemmatimonadaceae bacterium]|nr:hypothetical protein [Gemmatimonadaceae bacterium]
MTEPHATLPEHSWTFPHTTLTAAIALAVIGGGLLLFWIVLVGMSHFNGSRYAPVGYASSAFLSGASALFVRAGVRMWRSPNEARKRWTRAGAVTSHVLGAAAGVTAVWNAVSIMLFDYI